MVTYNSQRLLRSYSIIPILSHMCLDMVLSLPHPIILPFVQMCLDIVLPLPHSAIPTFIQMCLDVVLPLPHPTILTFIQMCLDVVLLKCLRKICKILKQDDLPQERKY